MRKTQIYDRTVGSLILLLFLLVIYLMRGIVGTCAFESPPYGENYFVQISGNIKWPGVYGFCQQPRLQELMSRAGGITHVSNKPLPSNMILCRSGSDIYLLSNRHRVHCFERQMSAFYKVTLGIPVSLNRASLEGLTAVPGIGPGLGGAIVRERAKRAGFKQLEDLLSIPGIGPTLYRKVIRYLTL